MPSSPEPHSFSAMAMTAPGRVPPVHTCVRLLSGSTWHYRGQLIKAPAEELTATSRSLGEGDRGPRPRERGGWKRKGGRGGEEASSEETHLDSLPRFLGRPRGKTVRQPAKIECGVRFRRRTHRRRDILGDEGGMAAFEYRELESFGGQWGSGRERRTHQRGRG